MSLSWHLGSVGLFFDWPGVLLGALGAVLAWFAAAALYQRRWRRSALFLFAFVGSCAATASQVWVTWGVVPTIAVVGSEGDPRLSLVDEGVSYWNKTLEEIGSGFRLGPITRVTQPIPEEALQSLSHAVVDSMGGPVSIPQALSEAPGDLTIFLGDSGFVSFASPFDVRAKRVVGIRGANSSPLNQPNVARNVIAHEIGHAIGLGHNSDSSKLMCGRPAACRPMEFRSDEPRLFPLTDDEKRQLLRLYPPDWKPRSP